MRIKVSQGARRSSWPGRWEAVCSDSCIWKGLGGFLHLEGGGSGSAPRAPVTKNKGFARRPQEFLGWEVGGRMWRFLHLEGGGSGGAAGVIKVSQGARRSSWPGRWEEGAIEVRKYGGMEVWRFGVGMYK